MRIGFVHRIRWNKHYTPDSRDGKRGDPSWQSGFAVSVDSRSKRLAEAGIEPEATKGDGYDSAQAETLNGL